MSNQSPTALAAAIKRKGITSELDRVKFANSFGVSETTLWRWERGKTRPSKFIQKAVARKLDQTVEEIWPLEEVA